MKSIGTILGLALSASIAFGASAKEALILTGDVPPGLDYDGPTAASPATQTGLANLLEPLVYYPFSHTNDEGVRILDFQDFEGRLAESWSFDASTLTWTFNLRRGVKGCNGAEFNADDVLYTFARAKSVSGSAPISWFLSNVASIAGFTPAVFGDDAAKKLGEEVKKIDDYTVQIKQGAPNKLMLPVLTIFGIQMLDKQIMEANATADDPWAHKYNNEVNAPGFGAYCLDTWKKSEEFVTTANPDYYRGKADIDRIVLRRVPQSSTRTIVVRSGQADVAELLTPKEYENLRLARGVNVVGAWGNKNIAVAMNFKAEPWNNTKLRQAIAHAIPYDRVIENAFFGEARRWESIVPTTYPGFSKTETQFSFDLDKARQLLSEAGFPDGKGLDAFPAESFLLTFPQERDSWLQPIGTAIRSALREVGVNIQLNPIPESQYVDRQLVKKDLQMTLIDSITPFGVDAGYAVQLFFVSPDKGGINNIINYSSEDLDGIYYGRIFNESDDDKRNQALAEAQDRVMADVAWAPVVEYKSFVATRDTISGVTYHPDNQLRWFDLKKSE